jgi:hypothetical protein
MSNLWAKDKKNLFREIYHQYLEEGYDHKLAKRLAEEEVAEIHAEDHRFIRNILRAEYEDE